MRPVPIIAPGGVALALALNLNAPYMERPVAEAPSE